MAPQLLEFPAEIIEKILKDLLPPLSARDTVGSSLDHDLECRPLPPVDLCGLMLVCKVFRSFAFPWVWRRVTIRCSDLTTATNPPDQSWSPKCHLDAGAAAHIRILHITIPLSSLSGALAALRPAVMLMDNIRVLKFTSPVLHGFQFDVLEEVYALLIAKPRLHTLITNHHTPTVRHTEYLRSLKNLYIRNDLSGFLPTLLQGRSLGLKSLVLQNYTDDILTLSLPWETLREIELAYVETWPLILNNFSLWKETSPNTSSPLAELYIRNFSVSYRDLKRLVVGFQSQNLTSFHVSNIEYIDGALLDIIADAFPRLQNLGMRDRVYNSFGHWRVDLSAVLVFLGKFARLKTLYWNYIGVWAHDSDGSALDAFGDILPLVGEGSRSVENVTFYNGFDSFSYIITRDDTGGYRGYVKAERRREATPWPTSSWHTSHYEEI